MILYNQLITEISIHRNDIYQGIVGLLLEYCCEHHTNCLPDLESLFSADQTTSYKFTCDNWHDWHQVCQRSIWIVMVYQLMGNKGMNEFFPLLSSRAIHRNKSEMFVIQNCLSYKIVQNILLSFCVFHIGSCPCFKCLEYKCLPHGWVYTLLKSRLLWEHLFCVVIGLITKCITCIIFVMFVFGLVT